jgi:hypothetical protein
MHVSQNLAWHSVAENAVVLAILQKSITLDLLGLRFSSLNHKREPWLATTTTIQSWDLGNIIEVIAGQSLTGVNLSSIFILIENEFKKLRDTKTYQSWLGIWLVAWRIGGSLGEFGLRSLRDEANNILPPQLIYKQWVWDKAERKPVFISLRICFMPYASSKIIRML